MKTKEKNAVKKEVKIKSKKLVFLPFIIAVLIYTTQVYFVQLKNSKTYGKEEINKEDVIISNAQNIDLDSIINKNIGENKREEIEKKEVDLEYLTKYKTNPKLPKGMSQVVQEGRIGKQELIIKKIYDENEEVISEEQISAKITKASMNKIVEIGGANYTSNYTVKVGDTVYVTAQRISVMLQPDESAQKIASLQKEDALKVIDIQGDWYSISSKGVKGWVKSESTTYINPNQELQQKANASGNTNKQEKPKEQLIAKFNFDMKLNEPSELSLNQFKKILTDNKDTNKVLQDNAPYFYYIEAQYKINGVFVASMAIHESAWGTSKIANNKKNLFGYGAYDSNPYNGAYNFTSYSESIDLIARVLVKYYLNPAGTKIYGDETATGSYYNSPTLTGVNTRYASDKGWANKVYQHMQYLYNKL